MRTSFGVGILGVAVGFLILGILLLELLLIALVIPLVVYLALGAVFAPVKARVKTTRTVESLVASEGDELEVSLQIENQGPGLEFLEVYDSLPANVEVAEGSNYLITSLRRGQTLEMTYTMGLRVKGRFTIGPILLRNRDLGGFAVNETRLDDTETIIVSPRREDLRRVRLFTSKTRPWLGQIPTRSPGLGTDFWSIRDYATGDEMRRLNWKASARLDRLLTNELEGERSGDFVLVLDAREEAALGQYQENAVEMGVRAVVSLAEVLLEGRNRVGLIILRSVLDWVYPAFGRKQLHRIREALIRVHPGGEWSLGHLPWILRRFFPPACQIIVISPIIDKTALEAVENMRAFGFALMVISPSIIELEASQIEGGEVTDVAHGILRLERETNIALLRQSAEVAEWRPDEPLALPLKEVERWRTTRR